MNQEKYTHQWGLTEFVFSAEASETAKRFRREILELSQEIRRDYRIHLEALEKILDHLGLPVQNEGISEEQLDEGIRILQETVPDGERLMIFVDSDRTEMLLETNTCSMPSEDAAKMGLAMPENEIQLVGITPELEQKLEQNRREHVFPEMIERFLKNLGIYEEALCVFQDEDDPAFTFTDLFAVSYNILEETIGQEVTMRCFFSAYGQTGFQESDSHKEKHPRSPEKVISKAALLDAPDKIWRCNMSCILIQPVTDCDLTEDEYRSLALDYFNIEMAEELMSIKDMGKPFECCLRLSLETNSSGLLDAVEAFTNILQFNIEIYDRCGMDFEQLPTEIIPHIPVPDEEGGLQRIPVSSIFVCSDRFELIEIPLSCAGTDTEMILTQY
ncbi:MAG: hypothetical protein IJ496_09190 [Ruminococcus sp.]|nr:hypothetical protein [Ruminococcus sp.]